MSIFDFFKRENRSINLSSSEQRKRKTQIYLKSLNIPFIDHLPVIEDETEVQIRTAQAIAERILILVYIALYSEEITNRKLIIDYLKKYSLWQKVSPGEKALLQKKELTEQEITDAYWRSESVWLLLWAINKVEKLDLPREQVELFEIASRIPKFFTNPKEFIESAVVRSTNEILDASDLLYRLHWAIRNTKLNPNSLVVKLNSSVVLERHYAINWVTYYADQWDDITTDT